MRALATLLTLSACIYALLALVLYLFQDKMVFLADVPGRELTTTPAAAGFGYEDVTITASDGVPLHGWYVHHPEPRGVVLFFHGNAGNISHRLDSIAVFHELGLDTFIIDYRGYGRSEGVPSEQGTYLDAEAAWEFLVEQRGADPSGIVLFGRSLGGAVAAWLAVRQTPAALVIESSFSSARDMAHRLYPFMPTGLITRLKYPVVDYVSQARSPVLIVHSRDDEIIPFAMGETLYRTAPEPKSFLELGGSHNGAFLLAGNQYLEGLGRFMDEHLKPSQ